MRGRPKGSGARDLTGEQFERLTLDEATSPGVQPGVERSSRNGLLGGKLPSVATTVPNSSFAIRHLESSTEISGNLPSLSGVRKVGILLNESAQADAVGHGRPVEGIPAIHDGEDVKVISRADSRSYRSYWNVRCSCGVEKEVSHSVLVGRKARSCGCLQQEVRISANTKHGYNRTPTYVSWCAMVARCANPKLKSYKNYGGRGIAVCDRWLEFSNFLADMGERPPGKSIDRFPDNDGHYEPGNCRWATASEQRINQRPRAAAEIGKAMK